MFPTLPTGDFTRRPPIIWDWNSSKLVLGYYWFRFLNQVRFLNFRRKLKKDLRFFFLESSDTHFNLVANKIEAKQKKIVETSASPISYCVYFLEEDFKSCSLHSGRRSSYISLWYFQFSLCREKKISLRNFLHADIKHLHCFPPFVQFSPIKHLHCFPPRAVPFILNIWASSSTMEGAALKVFFKKADTIWYGKKKQKVLFYC